MKVIFTMFAFIGWLSRYPCCNLARLYPFDHRVFFFHEFLFPFISLLLLTSKHACFQALLHSVPAGRLVVLDLFAEVKPIWTTSEQFYGVPYIWKVIAFFLFLIGKSCIA